MRRITLIIVAVLFFCGSCKHDETYTSKVREHLRDADSEYAIAKQEKEKEEEKSRREYLEGVEKRKAEKARLDSLLDNSVFINEDSSLTIIGIVQSSGIRSFDKHHITAEFQIEATRKSFFLVTEEDLSSFWGKRACAKGRLSEGWSLSMTENDSGTFGRLPLDMDSIMFYPNDSTIAFRYIMPKKEYHSYMDTLSGYIKRVNRICSDISMDYVLSLDEPFPHPEDPERIIEKIGISPSIDFDTLNSYIDNKTHIVSFGYIGGGYAESIVFETDSVIRY